MGKLPAVRLVSSSLTRAITVAVCIGVVVNATPQGSGRQADETRRVSIGTGVIAGLVTDPATNRPPARVRVDVTWEPSMAVPVPNGRAALAPSSRTTFTDQQGRFSLEHLPAAQFTLTGARGQYLSATYGQMRPGGAGTPISLADGQRVSIILAMTRAGVITGTIRGDDGGPLSNASVRVLRYGFANGFRALSGVGSTAITDDRGAYRIFGLQPGEYVVAVTPDGRDARLADNIAADVAAIDRAAASGTMGNPSGSVDSVILPPVPPTPGFVPVYFPASTSSSTASGVTLRAGEERSGVDIWVEFIRATTISGRVLAPSTVRSNMVVTLRNQSTPDPSTELSAAISVRPDGSFVINNVPPGDFVLVAETTPRTGPEAVVGATTVVRTAEVFDDSQRMWGRAGVSVQGRPVTDVEITLQPGRSISGHVGQDGSNLIASARGNWRVTLLQPPSPVRRNWTPPPQTAVAADGSFVLRGVVPGRYVFRITGAGAVKSAMLHGQDRLDVPFEVTGDEDLSGAEITLTDRVSELAGLLTDRAGRPAVNCTIVVAPVESRYWTPGSRRIGTTRPDLDGRYVLRDLPSGEYLVAAITDLEQGRQFDPEFLKTLIGNAVRVVLGDGARQIQNLRLGE